MASSERSKWTDLQLKTLFKHPNFCQPLGQTDNRVSYQKKLEDYWIPIVLLYTGARTGEICQLRTKDVQKVDGIWCLNINDEGEGRSIKTEASRRLIPVHKVLIYLGFIEYVARRKESNHAQLFSIKLYGENQSWSEQFGKRFAKVQLALGMKAPNRPTLHGLRHTFIDRAQTIGIPEYRVSDLVGHTKRNITYGRYGKRHDLETLNKAINLITFDTSLAPHSES